MSAALVADIGGTSSRWALLDGDGEPGGGWALPGFNPAVGDPALFQRTLAEQFQGIAEVLAVKQLHVYGAGCGSPVRRQRMTAVLRSVWPSAVIDVQSDLLGAARALHDDSPGFALILGTGMNAGWYDGLQMHTPMPSLGYILGDEGSGANIGKVVLRSALLDQLHPDLMHVVFPNGITMDEVAEQVYRGKSPQAWLAALAGRMAPMAHHAQARELVSGCFEALATMLTRYFSRNELKDLKASGSIAAGYRSLLEQALAARSMKLSDVQASPLSGLLHYHRKAGR